MRICGFSPYTGEYGEETWIVKVTLEIVAIADVIPTTTPGNEGAEVVVSSTEETLTGEAGVATHVIHTEYPAGLLGKPLLTEARPTITKLEAGEKNQSAELLVIVP